ncbi:MAG: chorismate synthase, partial [Clostridia bacterium]
MIGNFGKLKIEIFGESHSQFIGVRLGGVPSGMTVSDVAITAMLNRRKSSADVWSTPRHEDDNYEILSGIKNQITTGEIIEVVIKNIDANASNYLAISSCPRPSHADYVAYLKDGKITSGGGRFSGRMTAPLCIAGAIAEEILKAHGIDIYAYTSSVGNIELGSYKNCVLTKTALEATKTA